MKPAPSPEAFSNYLKTYDEHTSGRNLAGRFMSRGHEILEESLRPEVGIDTILEVGAGTGQHIRYVKCGYEKYVISDQNQEMLGMAKENLPSDLSGLVSFDYQNAAKTTYPAEHFDRIIASHVLEHIVDPVAALTEWNRIVRIGGVISIVLPCDPGMLWSLGRRLGPRRRAVKAGVAYDYNQASEHVNSIQNLVVFLRHHFEDIDELWYPARVALPDCNLFYVCHIYKS